MAAEDYYDLVQQFYIGYYGRPADPTGLDYWAGKVDEADGDFTVVLDAFATSDEATDFVFTNPDTGDDYTNEELVINIYENLFGRDPSVDDQEGLDFYVNGLDSGEFTAQDVVKRVVDGAQNEDATTLDNKVQVAQYFTDNLGDKQYTSDDILDARALLTGIDETDSSVETAKTEVDDFIADQPSGSGGEGETFTLTEAVDEVSGTDGDDTITAPAYNQDSELATTFSTGDEIDGGDGIDTFNIEALANGDDYNDTFPLFASVENVEIVNINNNGDVAATGLTDASDYVGVQQLWQYGAATDVTNLADTTVAGFNFEADEAAADFEHTVTSTAAALSSSLLLQDIYDPDYVDGSGEDLGTFNIQGDALETANLILENAGRTNVQVPAYTLDDDELRTRDDESIPGQYIELYFDSENQVETFNIDSTGDDRGNFVRVYNDDAVTDLNITGDADLKLRMDDTYALETVDASALNADLDIAGTCDTEGLLTIVGAQGDNVIKGLSGVDVEVTTFDGDDDIRVSYGSNDPDGFSGSVIDAGDGDNEIHVRGSDNDTNEILTGSGNDVIHMGYVNTEAANTVLTGAGDDDVRVNDRLSDNDYIDGGDGYDMLTMAGSIAVDATTSADTEFADLFDNFEFIGFKSLTGTVDMAYLDDIQHVALKRSINDSTIEGLSDDATLEMWGYRWSTDRSAYTTEVNLTDTGGEESFNLVLNGTGVGSDDDSAQAPGTVDQHMGTVSMGGVETLNLSTSTRCKDFDVRDGDLEDGIDVSFINYGLALNMDSLATLNITGETRLDLTDQALTTVETVNAGDFDQNLKLDLTGNTNDVTVTAGDGDNVIIGGDGDDTITTGAGDDEIIGGAGGDDLTGSDGDDTFVYEAASDSSGSDIDVIQDFTSLANYEEGTDPDEVDNDTIDFGSIGGLTNLNYLGEFDGQTAAETVMAEGSGNLEVALDTSANRLYVDVNDNGDVDTGDMIIQLTGVTEMTQNDFAYTGVEAV